MELGAILPLWSCLPFVGMLLSIAIAPLVKPEWWETHQLHASIFWALLFVVPFGIFYGLEICSVAVAEIILLDYVPFIVLLLGLFTVSGGIHIKGAIPGTPRNNTFVLAIGTLLSSVIGTTGSAMLLIRPMLRSNYWRKSKAHIFVFFIFLIANIGGCLTPLGDPPLFLGYLRGVPFFWTLQHIWPLFLVNSAILLAVFYALDTYMLKREGEEGKEALELHIAATKKIPFGIEGNINFLFIGMILFAVIINGVIAQSTALLDPETGLVYGITVLGEIHLGINWFLQVGIILIASLLSLKFTSKRIRVDNEFEWEPILEVARLFIGIFLTMIPALELLSFHGAELGLTNPIQFFWATGLLSSFLDNSPTYVVFLTTAGSLGTTLPDAIPTAVGLVDHALLLAISAGAVFMGAITYIGNAPNFIVKSIAERNGVKMPSFFGYMKWSLLFLIPVFALDTFLFFM